MNQSDRTSPCVSVGGVHLSERAGSLFFQQVPSLPAYYRDPVVEQSSAAAVSSQVKHCLFRIFHKVDGLSRVCLLSDSNSSGRSRSSRGRRRRAGQGAGTEQPANRRGVGQRGPEHSSDYRHFNHFKVCSKTTSLRRRIDRGTRETPERPQKNCSEHGNNRKRDRL